MSCDHGTQLLRVAIFAIAMAIEEAIIKAAEKLGYADLRDFVGTANSGFKIAYVYTSYTHLPFCSTHLAIYKPYLRVRAVLLHSTDTCVAFLQSW